MKACIICGDHDRNELVWFTSWNLDDTKNGELQLSLCAECRRLPEPRVADYKGQVVSW